MREKSGSLRPWTSSLTAVTINRAAIDLMTGKKYVEVVLAWREYDAGGNQTGNVRFETMRFTDLPEQDKAAVKRLLQRAHTYARNRIEEPDEEMPGIDALDAGEVIK